LRKGCMPTLNTVPGGKEFTDMPSRAIWAEPPISTAQTTGSPFASRSTFLRSAFMGAKKICRWLGAGSTRVTTPVNTLMLFMSYMAKLWWASTGTLRAAPASAALASRVLGLKSNFMCLSPRVLECHTCMVRAQGLLEAEYILFVRFFHVLFEMFFPDLPPRAAIHVGNLV